MECKPPKSIGPPQPNQTPQTQLNARPAMERRVLAPPKLDDTHLGARLVCHRPCRPGPPRMCIEYRNNGHQLVAHNYGHAGSGWSLAPGVVSHVNSLLEKALLISGKGTTQHGNGSGHPRPAVVVIGAGVVGLFTAYDLLQRGFRQIIVVVEEFDGLPSHNAGGLLSPRPCGAIYDTDSQTLIDRCAIDAYHFYIAISRGNKANFPSEAAKTMTAYFDAGVSTGLEPYIGKVLEPPKEVLVQFGHHHCAKTHRMLAFDDNVFLNTRLLMGTLKQLLTDADGVIFVQRKVESFAEFDTNSVIVNCAGIGAKELCGDQEMFPVQGHLIMLKDQNPAELNYLLLHEFGHGTSESGHQMKRDFYLFPKRSSSEREENVEKSVDIGVIGGTFIQDCGPDTPNLSEFDQIIQNAKEFLGIEN